VKEQRSQNCAELTGVHALLFHHAEVFYTEQLFIAVVTYIHKRNKLKELLPLGCSHRKAFKIKQERSVLAGVSNRMS
jgi:hypothetical protein